MLRDPVLVLVLTVIVLFTTTASDLSTTTTSTYLDTTNLSCRTVSYYKGYYCPVEHFNEFACLSCYLFLPEHVIPKWKKFKVCENTVRNCTHVSLCRKISTGNITFEQKLAPADYNYSDPTSAIYETFETEADKQLWRICCEDAAACCRSMINKPVSTAQNVCPRTWDGWQCFDETPAGESYEAPCPIYSYLRAEVPSCPVTFSRPCESTGVWSRYPNSTKEWTNYSTCHAFDIILRRHYTHLAAYGVSLLALVPAIVIFLSYKQLRVPRITMHINLFISIFLNGVVFIVFKKIVILSAFESSGSLVRDDNGWCKFLFVLTKYFRTTNYMWMFCEGFYLHRLIVAAFNEQKRLHMYYIIGWAFPILPVIIYSILRATNEQANKRCWVVPQESYEWVFNAPNLISLMTNFIFLCNIIRVLVSKLRATNTTEPSQYRKAVRATLVLVPLFGLHFVITIWMPTSGPCEWREAYYYVNYLLDGLQGFLVSLIFCYLNGEVHCLIKRSLERWRLRRHPQNFHGFHSTSTQVTSVYESPSCTGSVDGRSSELTVVYREHSHVNGLSK